MGERKEGVPQHAGDPKPSAPGPARLQLAVGPPLVATPLHQPLAG